MHGGEFATDWAQGGFAPMWNAPCEAAASHPELAMLRMCVYHSRSADDGDPRVVRGGAPSGADDELIACEVVTVRVRARVRVRLTLTRLTLTLT